MRPSAGACFGAAAAAAGRRRRPARGVAVVAVARRGRARSRSVFARSTYFSRVAASADRHISLRRFRTARSKSPGAPRAGRAVVLGAARSAA